MSAVNYIVKGDEGIIWDPTQDWQAQFNMQLNAYLIKPRSRSKDHEAFALRLQGAHNQETLVRLLTSREGLKQRGGLFGLGKPSWLHAFCLEALQQLHSSQSQEIEKNNQAKAKSAAERAELIKVKDAEITRLTEQLAVDATANFNLNIDTKNQVAAVVRRQNELSGVIDLLRTQLSEAEAKVSAQQAQIETHVSDKTQLQTHVGQLKDQVSSLSVQLRAAQDRAEEVPVYREQLAATTEKLAVEQQVSSKLVHDLAKARLENADLQETLTFALKWIDNLFGKAFGWSPSEFLSKQQEPPLPAKAPEVKDEKSNIFSRFAFWNKSQEPTSAPADDKRAAPELQSP